LQTLLHVELDREARELALGRRIERAESRKACDRRRPIAREVWRVDEARTQLRLELDREARELALGCRIKRARSRMVGGGHPSLTREVRRAVMKRKRTSAASVAEKRVSSRSSLGSGRTTPTARREREVKSPASSARETARSSSPKRSASTRSGTRAARSKTSSAKKRPVARPNVDDVVARLRKLASKRWRDGLARFAIPSEHALGIPVGKLRAYSKELGRDHALALRLWKTGWLEARMLAAFVDDPARVTSAQMDRWCRDFDNWAIVDTACFHLFDRTVEAWKMVERWSRRSKEFEKRAAFALLWSLSVHDKQSSDAPFLHGLRLIEREAHDERNFVKKAVNMSLRAVGKRSRDLNAAAIDVARRLARSENAAARWNGKDSLRELESASVERRLAAKRAR
jgi:3-methyladenine DNA glycosylase AlkD